MRRLPSLGTAPRPRRPPVTATLLGLLAVFVPGLRAARAEPLPPPDAAACAAAITRVEPDSRLPPGLLAAIAINESARVDPFTRRAAAWPWTVNIAGAGQTFDTKAAAIAAVRAAQLGGVRSIDVGCMQVNLYFHPHAFATLDEAFDPLANVRYASGFLTDLRAQTGGWAAAVAAYHSATPELGLAYAGRVAANWPAGARFGVTPAASQAALDALSLEAEVDPRHVLTPQFRASLIASASFRRQRDAGGGARMAGGQTPAAPARHAAPGVAELEAEVDPKGILTPAFRAAQVASAAQRHQREAQRARDARPPVPLSLASSPVSGSPRS